MSIPFLDPGAPLYFPNPETALAQPDGLLCAGGDLSPERLKLAYKSGIFPWFSDEDPILWWSPSIRCVLVPDALHVSRSLAKRLRQGRYTITRNRAFERVVSACAAARPGANGTWITESMRDAYCLLHHHGAAHSVEAWRDDTLVGGLYGVAVGRLFCGESMFSVEPDASKVALHALATCSEFDLIDCQMPTKHLMRLGAERMTRADFLLVLRHVTRSTH
ncbi:MAG: leucyl/phenylalanyl-tRNA--protein transferase [Pseudomonadota bacterium]